MLMYEHHKADHTTTRWRERKKKKISKHHYNMIGLRCLIKFIFVTNTRCTFV